MWQSGADAHHGAGDVALQLASNFARLLGDEWVLACYPAPPISQGARRLLPDSRSRGPVVRHADREPFGPEVGPAVIWQGVNETGGSPRFSSG